MPNSYAKNLRWLIEATEKMLAEEENKMNNGGPPIDLERLRVGLANAKRKLKSLATKDQ